MGPDLQIDWTTVCKNPADFEKLVKLLLQKLHPRGEVLDGTGGDGGREFQVRTAGRLELYEAKSFTGRMSRRNPKRRSQVEDSLKSAGRLQPDAWHLVVPVDHNPDELAWFDGLRAGDYDFVDQWLGQTWLETQLAQHPDLLRYATESKLLEYVRYNKLEQEALVNGGADLVERYRRLQRLANEVNLYWRPAAGQFPDGTWYSTVEAKRDDAAIEAPITFTLGVDIPAAAEYDELRATWRTHLDFGTDVSIPGQFVTEFKASGPAGLGLPDGATIPDRIEVVAVPDTDVSNLPVQHMEVFEPGRANPTAALTFHPAHSTRGVAGGIQLTAYDPSRSVKLLTDVRADQIRLAMQAQEAAVVTPADYRASLRFARALTPPAKLVLTLSLHGERQQQATDIERPFLANPPSDDLIEFVENLAVVQEKLSMSFPVPASYTGRDAAEVRRLRRLLEGEQVRWHRGPLQVSIWPDRVDAFRAQFVGEQPGWFVISYDDFVVDIDGHSLHTGPIWWTGQIAVDVDKIITDEQDASPKATFEVLGDGWMYAKLGKPEDQDGERPEAPEGTGGVAIRTSTEPDTS